MKLRGLTESLPGVEPEGDILIGTLGLRDYAAEPVVKVLGDHGAHDEGIGCVGGQECQSEQAL